MRCCASALEIPEADQDRSALKFVVAKRRDRMRSYFDALAGNSGASICPAAPGRSGEVCCDCCAVMIADLGAGKERFRNCLRYGPSALSRLTILRKWWNLARSSRGRMVCGTSNTGWGFGSGSVGGWRGGSAFSANRCIMRIIPRAPWPKLGVF